MVPQLTDLREEILREFHCSRFFVHPGATKMCETPRKSNFLKKGKIVISVKILNFFRSRMMKRTSPL